MNYSIYSKRTAFLVILTLFSVIFSFGQTAKLPAPRENTLLNGLKLLVWTEPTAEKVTIKLRIHSGASFDPKDKMGVMAMLADSFFPTEQAKAFFTEDLEGSLEVTSNYDYIQITATGKQSEVLAMIETMANAVVNPQLTPENFKLVSSARIAKVQELEKTPAYLAERAVAKRLFGDFPYGRSAEGTSESLAKIDRADLIFAKERFLSSDNATIAVIGNVKPDFIYRATRQLFGAWTKSDKKVPATFRQPDEITKGKQFVEIANSEKAEIYQATRSFARNSKDFPAGLILTEILSNRLKKVGEGFQAETFVNNKSYLLFGTYTTGVKIAPEKAAEFSQKIHQTDFIKPVTDSEFQESKNLIISKMSGALNEKHSNADFWLDADTYKLPNVSQQFAALQNVTLNDVNNVLNKVFNSAFVETVLGDAAKLKDFVSANKPN